jgi:hypothetical protein
MVTITILGVTALSLVVIKNSVVIITRVYPVNIFGLSGANHLQPLMPYAQSVMLKYSSILMRWPWPIHPCFDKDKTKSKLNKKINPSKSVGRASSKFVKIISNSKKESGVIIIDVQYGRKAMRFYCKCFESIDYLMSIKNKIRMEALTKGRMRFLCGVSVSKNIIGYPSIKDLLASSIKTTKSTNTDWKKWDGKLKLDYGTSMASAMELVLSKRK